MSDLISRPEKRTEEHTKTHACDCIDRQAALDIFDDYNVAVENGQIEAYSRDRKRLCNLPPAQPELSEEDRRLLKKLRSFHNGSYAKVIDRLMSAQPEQRTGKWERHYSRPNVYADLCWHCSACGYYHADNWTNKFKYCPNCGAKMK